MAITRQNPNTVYLGGERSIVINDLAASEAITPGHLVERFNNAGVIRFRKQNVAAVNTPKLVALEHSMANKGVDDAYAANDLVEVAAAQTGSTWWMLLAASMTIVAGDKLCSAGDGTLRKVVTTDVALFTALENITTTGAVARIRVEAL